MPDLRSWLERGGFDSSDPGLTDHGRRLSTRRLVPRSTRVEWIRACTPDVSCTRGALSTEAKHLIPHRRMGAFEGAPRSQKTAFLQTPDHPSTDGFRSSEVGIFGNDAQTGMLPGRPESAGCVRGLRDSPNSAIRTTYRVSPRSSSAWEPRYPSSKVVD